MPSTLMPRLSLHLCIIHKQLYKMKKVYLSFLCALGFVSLMAQTTVHDSVVLGPGTLKQSYYSLANGEQANVSNTSWDLQFRFNGFSAGIRPNDGNYVQLYLPVVHDTGAWTTLDTTGMTPLYNGDDSWDNDAFYASKVVGDTFDYGWGTYNMITHNLIGTKVFVISTAPGVYKKLWIKSLVGGTDYTFQYANLDNSGLQVATIRKSLDPTKNFIMYNLTANNVVNIEPAGNAWDIVFRKYARSIDHYGVVGALSNIGIHVASVHGVANPDAASGSGLTYYPKLSAIGYDWKSFTPPAGPWVVGDSVAYFVEDAATNIWRLVFKGYSGGGSGIISFNKTKVHDAVGIAPTNQVLQSAQVYPNPVEANSVLLFHLTKATALQATIVDMNGKVIYTQSVQGSEGLNQWNFGALNMSAGNYIMQLSGAGVSFTEKLSVQ
jgi:Secretion system C-terminal sorting domain